MKINPQQLASFGGPHWAINEHHFKALQSIDVDLKCFTPQYLQDVQAARAKQLRKVNGRIAVFNVFGIIEQRMSLFGAIFGGVGADDLGVAIAESVADASVGAIVLNVDSPGGTVPGVQELSKKLFELRGEKPIITITNALNASAAIWFSSAADQHVITPSGDTASIGVFTIDVTEQRALDQAGIDMEILRVPDGKADFNPIEPLSEEARQHVMSDLHAIFDQFVSDVARNRGVSPSKVKNDFGKGRTMRAKQAVEAGLADRIDTFEGVLQKLGKGVRRSGGRRTSVARKRLALGKAA